jgi:hypothetical protein
VFYRWFVAAVLVLHFGYIAFVILGGFLAWRWPKVFWVHLVAIAWAVLIVANWVNCPLTYAENWGREKQGQAPIAGFIDKYLTGVIYPARYLQEVRLAVALVVVISWIGVYVTWRRRRRRAVAAASQDTPSAVASHS